MSFRKTEFQNNGATISSNISKVNFSSRISVVDDGNGGLTISVISGDILKKTGDSVTGNITLNQGNIVTTNGETIDGRHVAADGLILDAINTDTGILVRTGTNLFARRSITGTANQIAVANGDGVAGNPTISLPNRVALPGVEGFVLPKGSTAQRMSPESGLLRYNSTDNVPEIFTGDDWHSLIIDNDPRLDDPHVLYVSQTENSEGFTSIAAAMESIQDATFLSRYLIDVAPGVYLEPQIVFKEFVTIRGSGHDVTGIGPMPGYEDQHLIVGCPNSSISDVSVGTQDPMAEKVLNDVASIYVSATTNLPSNSFIVENLRFADTDYMILVEQPLGTTCSVFCNNIHIGGSSALLRGFTAKGPGTARINVRTMTSNGTLSVAPTHLFYADGSTSAIICSGTTVRSSAVGGAGIHARNGATIRMVGVSLLGFAKAVWSENFGTAPTLNLQGMNLQNNTADLLIEHPGTMGSFQGSAQRSKVTIDPLAPITVFYSDPYDKGITSVGPVYLGKSHATSINVEPLITAAAPMGVYSGGTLHDPSNGAENGGLQVQVAAGYGFCVQQEGGQPRLYRVDWPTTLVNLSAFTSVFVYVTYNGTITTSPTPAEVGETILLGRVSTDNNSIDFIEQTAARGNHMPNFIERTLRRGIGPIFYRGSVASEGTQNRRISVTPGEYFYGSLNFKPLGGTDITFRQYNHNASGQWVDAAVNTINNTQRDTPTGLVNLTAGYFIKHALFLVGDEGIERYMLVIGSSQYATLVEAETAELPLPPTSFSDSVVLIAAFVVQQGVGPIAQVHDHRPVVGSKSPMMSAAATHGNLLGLAADDHPQYMLANGMRPMAGDIAMGGFSITGVDQVDGVDVSAHAARHLPNGSDPLASAAPTTDLTLATTNTIGGANSFARSDHTHRITGVQPVSTELTALAALATTGMMVRTAANTYATRTWTAPASGLTVSNADGLAGNPTLALANDLAAIEGLSSTGLAIRSGTDTWTVRSIAGTANQIAVTNGTGVSGNPTIALAANAVLPGTEGFVPPTGTTAQRPVTPILGETRFNTSLSRLEFWDGTAWLTASAVPRVFAAYVSSNYTVTTSRTGVPFQVEIRKDSGFTHAVNSASITIGQTGFYFVDVDVGLGIVSGSSPNATVNLLRNGSVITGSSATMSSSGGLFGSGTESPLSVKMLVQLTAGDVFQVGIIRSTSTTMNVVANATRITIREVL